VSNKKGNKKPETETKVIEEKPKEETKKK